MIRGDKTTRLKRAIYPWQLQFRVALSRQSLPVVQQCIQVVELALRSVYLVSPGAINYGESQAAMSKSSLLPA